MTDLRVLMLPTLKHFRSEESGIKRVVEAYTKHLPAFGIKLVGEGEEYDIKASHAGTNTDGIAVCHSHGLYWTADYTASAWEWKANADVIEAMCQARIITCPSEWVAETILRDMRRKPVVVGHGIDWESWQGDSEKGDYVLWNKNRNFDVCTPEPLDDLAGAFSDVHFVTTFAPKRRRLNVEAIGIIPHDQMKMLVKGALVYLSTTKETFGIGVLEAMAAGVPVLGFAHGGNLELVEHGINGYLAEPGNAEDLQRGLDYCLQHRQVLGENGRELARYYTWEAACEKVAKVYRDAAEVEEPTAAIIIPSWNYADKVGRAIRGAVTQTYPLLREIIVVDDGSTDDGATETAVRAWTEQDSRVRYIRQDNAGVAAARNAGIAATWTKYVSCLDADDTLEPGFIETCVDALESDQSLGLAYTALRYILPDGKTGVSPWPPAWNYDDQLKRKNQVPTCCVYRREVWESLGGYKSRYCPKGAGSEDAEFWTRIGAYGWKCAKVTGEPLFVYSWQTGRVSGNKEYSEPDWLAWHPWAFDNLHPFASYATPKRFSHPVRQYDEPVVSVVIPVGPTHDKHLEDALDSIEAQTFRQWEVIVAWDRDDDPPERYVNAYPYVEWLIMGANEGSGAARNAGAKLARAPFLLFLDADDILDPGCIAAMLNDWREGEAVIYSDYIGKAFIANVRELEPKLQKAIVWRDESDGLTAIRYEAPDYDAAKAQMQPTGDPTKIYTWNLITSLVPRAWHEAVGGFDEDMPSWEDVDYFWRLAKEGYCFRRVPEPLVIYHFYTGGRRDFGHSQHQTLFQYLIDKHERIEVKMCKSCGGRRQVPPPAAQPIGGAVKSAPNLTLDNESFKLCTYTHPSRGQSHVYGAAIFRERLDGVHMIQDRNTRLWRIHYGWRAGGDKFLVHVEDIKQSPHLFREEQVLRAPVVEREPLPAPTPIVEDAPQEPDNKPYVPPIPKPINLKAVMGKKANAPVEKGNGDFDPQKLPGVTPKIAQVLKARGISSLDDVLDLGEEGLQDIEGIGAVRARAIYGRAMELAAHVS